MLQDITTMAMLTDLSLLRLLQLVSPALPIGAFSYSQGLEKAVEDGWLHDVDSTSEWLHGIAANSLARIDIPLLVRCQDAWQAGRASEAANWSANVLAHRETSELREEDRQTGRALARVLASLNVEGAATWQTNPRISLAGSFALAAHAWGISRQDAAFGYLWAWTENQVLAAMKLVPLGQSAGQRLLHELAESIPVLVQTALQLNDEDIGGGAFALALASSRHEHQYSRLFRS